MNFIGLTHVSSFFQEKVVRWMSVRAAGKHPFGGLHNQIKTRDTQIITRYRVFIWVSRGFIWLCATSYYVGAHAHDYD
jgi:hypothetical protein